MKSKNIVICGLDGSGKSSLANGLKEQLIESRFTKTVDINAPYKPYKHYGKLKEVARLNSIPNAEELFGSDICSLSLIMDFWESYTSIEKLDPSHTNIHDRWIITSQVYAPILGSNEEFINQLVQSFPKPDLVIFLDVHPETCMSRVKSRADVELSVKEKLHTMIKARRRYKEVLKDYNHVILDCNNSPSSEYLVNKVMNLKEIKEVYV